MLDEINLAPSATLQRLLGLLDSPTASVALTERGDWVRQVGSVLVVEVAAAATAAVAAAMAVTAAVAAGCGGRRSSSHRGRGGEAGPRVVNDDAGWRNHSNASTLTAALVMCALVDERTTHAHSLTGTHQAAPELPPVCRHEPSHGLWQKSAAAGHPAPLFRDIRVGDG